MEDSMSEDTFLTADEIATLTGRRFKALQIEWLRRAGIPHWVNAAGRPVVARATITGQKSQAELPPRKWTPRVLQGDLES